MFAQLFGAAKRAISRTPSYQGRSSEVPEEVPEILTSDPAPQETSSPTTDTPDATSTTAITTVDMVTTRRGTETPGMGTPASSQKKAVGKRELDALDTPTQVKRQRKTTVELKRNLRSTPRKGGDAPSAESTQDDEAVSDTAEATPKAEDKSSPLAIRRRSSPKVVVEPSSPVAPAEDGFHTPEPASSEANFVTPFTSKKALAGSPTPKANDTDTPAAAKKARGRPKKAQKDDSAGEIPSSTQESSAASPPVAAQPPKAHVRFGSEEPTMNAKGHTRYDAPAPVLAATQQDGDDDDSGSDSDEAPEQVSTSAAASRAAASQAETARALAAAQEKERAKRSAREARLASEQAAKRERDALKASKAAARAAKAARLSSIHEAASEDEDNEPAHSHAHTSSSIPSLLPASLLANISDERPPTPPPEARGKSDEELRREKLNRHIKFLEQSSKAPKDRRVGKHHVAVLGERSGVLPAKVSKGSRGVREGWLKGRDGAKKKKGGKKTVGKTQRASFGGRGFLRGED